RGLVVAFVERAVLTVALGPQVVAYDAALHERLDHRVSAVFGEPQVVIVVGALVGVPLDFEKRELGVVDDRRADRVENCIRLGQDLGAARLEEHLLQDEDVVVLDDHVALVGASVLILVAVVRLGLVGALVLHVGDPVVIVVGVRTAILILEAVAV